ncbi:MAG TPA: choice-of-anchor Q domain-containing protein, partial [Kiritimatiellia bacterium]|nr:choice-of-anchor Q domain-containing protein [Kiritimatiellia bacterium]
MKSAPFLAWRLALLPGLALAVAMPSARAATRYVSPTGTHTPPYESWADAATNIQAAIDFCSPGDTVMLTNGTWLLETTAQVTNEVTLTSLNGRETVTLDGSALPAGSDVVFLQFGTLDGLTISNAPRHGVKSEYGAVFNSRIVHSGQTGIDSYTTPRIVTNSTLIVSNTIVQQSGSNGIYTCAVDTRILGCLITGSDGTGVSLRQNDTTGIIQVPRVSNFLIRASTVSSNRNSGIALAFYNYSADLPQVPVRVDDCLIEDNAGIRGGGVSDGAGNTTVQDSGVQITRSVIRRNTAPHGGGVYFLPNRFPSIAGSLIEDNACDGNGGGVLLKGGTVSSCLVRRNAAGNNGGGIYMETGAVGTFNSTVMDNRANRGGGTYAGQIYNSIVYYNQADVSANTYAGTVSYSCTTPLAAGSGNLTNPPALAGFLNWRLVPGSPCIDAGSFEYAAGDFDLDSDPRIWGGGVDMGCDEFYPPGLGGPLEVEVEADTDRAVVGTPVAFRGNVDGMPESYVWTFTDGYSVSNTPFVDRAFDVPGIYTVMVTATNADGAASNSVVVEIFPGYTNYVDAAGLHVFPYTNRPDAATNLQDAVAANIRGGVVMVADGIYDQGGIAVNGGPTNRIAVTNVIDVISENGPANAWIVGQGPIGDSAVRCAYVGAGARLTGFTLTNGHTWTTGNEDRDQSGGGAWLENGGILDNCRILGNRAAQSGGGVKGGTILQSTLSGNTALHGGGAAAADLVQCVLSNNTALGTGGGAGGGTMENVLAVNNQAEYGGGAASNSLLHSTLAGNHATASGGGMYRSFATNSIVYFNTADSNWPNFFNSLFTRCCTTPDPQAPGCLTNDPLFADAAGGDFQLLAGSPAIDAALPTDLDHDLTRQHRPLLGIPGGTPAPDMGAYEHLHATADTDGDGLGDRDEIDLYLTDFLLPDTDGDRQLDGAEIVAGMDPLDPGSLFLISRMAWDRTNQTVSWPGRAGRLYTIVATD